MPYVLSQHRETNLPIKGGSPLYRAEGLLPSLGGLIRVLYNETQSSLTWLVSLDALPTIHYCPRLPFVCLTGVSNAQCKHWLLSVEVRLVLPCGTHNFAPPHLSTRSRVASQQSRAAPSRAQP